MFDVLSVPSLLFRLLQAIEFLSRIEMFQSHAVHFAIALHDMELLNLTDSIQSKLCELLKNIMSCDVYLLSHV